MSDSQPRFSPPVDASESAGPPSGLLESVFGPAFIESGKAAVFAEMVINDMNGFIESLKILVPASEWDGIREDAHAMKSVARQCGAQTLADLCLQLEKAGESRNMEQDSLNATLNALLSEYDKIEIALRRYLTAR